MQEGIDVIWETIGGEMFTSLFRTLAIRGRIVIIGSTQTYLNEGFVDAPVSKLNAKVNK